MSPSGSMNWFNASRGAPAIGGPNLQASPVYSSGLRLWAHCRSRLAEAREAHRSAIPLAITEGTLFVPALPAGDPGSDASSYCSLTTPTRPNCRNRPMRLGSVSISPAASSPPRAGGCLQGGGS